MIYQWQREQRGNRSSAEQSSGGMQFSVVVVGEKG